MRSVSLAEGVADWGGDGEAGHVDEAVVMGAGMDDEGTSLEVAVEDGVLLEDDSVLALEDVSAGFDSGVPVLVDFKVLQ